MIESVVRVLLAISAVKLGEEGVERQRARRGVVPLMYACTMIRFITAINNKLCAGWRAWNTDTRRNNCQRTGSHSVRCQVPVYILSNNEWGTENDRRTPLHVPRVDSILASGIYLYEFKICTIFVKER